MNAGSTAQQIDLPFQDLRRQPTRLGCQKESDRRGPRRRFHQWSRMEEWKRWNGRLAKVATDTNILDLRTRYRSKLGWFFCFCPIQRHNTTKGKWQILYLRTRYRSKLGWIFRLWPIQRYDTTMGKWQMFYLRTRYRGLLHKIVRFETYLPGRYVSLGVGMFPFLRNVPTSPKRTLYQYVRFGTNYFM